MMPTQPPGWYRDGQGHLRYWNGESWAGQVDIGQVDMSWPGSAPYKPAIPAPPWRMPVIVLGWIAAIFFLGMLLTDVRAGGVDCGTVLSPRDAGAQCAAALHSRSTSTMLTGIAVATCFAASSRAAARIGGSGGARGARVLA